MSHRGGAIEALENTMEAFKHSVKLGVHVIECDVLITKDGEMMVAHDQEFDRVFNNKTFTKEMNKIRLTDADDLPEFKDKIDVLFTWPTVYYTTKSTDSKTYTRLEDIFKEIP